MFNKIFHKIKNKVTRLEEKICPVCNSKVEYFLPLPEQFRGKVVIREKEYLAYNESEMLNSDEYSCPNCGASDRERMYALYIKQYLFTQKKPEDIKMVHFAPEASLRSFLSHYEFKEYRTADLMMEGVDDKADLTKMLMYQDNYFDFFICSHMLEHIIDDIAAMKELYRILKPKSSAILVVPILLGLDELHEDSSIVTEEDRLLNFAQEDHVRMYNKKGYIERLKSVGFKVKEYTVNDFSKQLFFSAAITPQSVLYIVEK